MNQILERLDSSWNCLKCLYKVSLLPDAMQHAKDEHGVKYLLINEKGVWEQEGEEASKI